MSNPGPVASGIVGTLRTLGDTLLASVRDRVELFSIELEEEKCRLIQAFVWISAAMFTGVMVLAFASLTLVYLFWDSARIAVLAGLTGLYAVLLAVILLALRRMFARQPRPFSATLEELEEDRRCMRTEP